MWPQRNTGRWLRGVRPRAGRLGHSRPARHDGRGRDEARHRGIHGGARGSSHGAERAAAGARSRRRHGRDRRGRQPRHQHAGRPWLRSGRRERQVRGGRVPARNRRIADPAAPVAGPRLEADGSRAVGWRRRQRRRRSAHLAHAHHGLWWQHRQCRAGRQPRTAHHGDAVHPARREPARDQFRGDAPRAASRSLASPRHRPAAGKARPHRRRASNFRGTASAVR